MVAGPSLFVGVQVNFLILSGLVSGGRNIVRVFNDTAKAQVRSLRKVGMPLAKIASELGLNVNTVKSWCRRNNITPSSTNKTVVRVADVVGCLICGSELTIRQSRFCCESCRRAWWKTHPDQINRKAFYTFTCAHCAKQFTAYGNAKRKYCCHPCYIRHRFGTQGGRG
ncbi:RNA polymerase subunit sigma-70 [Varibaculum sp.]|uniref:terminase gpP N-terminus-related DNA-binding protein n=2 Tax=Varibaculum sp. TaxID=1895474 RepID=UPI003448E9D9